MSLPKLKLKKLDTEAAKAVLDAGKTKSGLKPGRYEMVVEEVTYRGPIKRDDTWHAFGIKFKVADDKTVYHSFIVPTETLTLANVDGDEAKATKDGARAVSDLVTFLTGLGIENPLADLSTAISTSFGADGTSLVGKNIAADLDYMNNRIVGEGDGEERVYYIQFRSGKKATGETGEVLAFPDIQAAEAYAKDSDIYVFNGVSPKSFHVPAVKNTFGKSKKTGSDNW